MRACSVAGSSPGKCGSIWNLASSKYILDAPARTSDAAAVTGECVPSPRPSALALSVRMEGCAMFPANAFDAETLGVLTRALEDAWIAVQSALGVTPLDPDQLKSRLANRIMAAAASAILSG